MFEALAPAVESTKALAQVVKGRDHDLQSRMSALYQGLAFGLRDTEAGLRLRRAAEEVGYAPIAMDDAYKLNDEELLLATSCTDVLLRFGDDICKAAISGMIDAEATRNTDELWHAMCDKYAAESGVDIQNRAARMAEGRLLVWAARKAEERKNS